MRADERVLTVQASLTGRDLRLMGWLYDHGVLTTPQIIAALFGSTSFAQRRLLRLLHLGVLARFRPLKPDGGSFPYHWLLDQPGTEVVAAQRGDPLPRPGMARARRLRLTSRANLPHLLGVNGLFTALAAYERTHPGTCLADWQPASRFTDSGELYQPGDDLGVLSVRVRPDGYGLWAENGVTVGFFLEYDTGTEPLPVLLDKVGRYHRLWVAKRHPSPVLFVLPTALRELHLHQRLGDRVPAGGVPAATTSTDLLASTGLSPAGAVWWLHADSGGRRRLIELPTTRDWAVGTPGGAGGGGGW